ncbi:MAG TPA: TolC family protein [Smithellaceae bacterium]|nr:TolC family protein [Smithellaceae bacterium]HQM45656.1 TolC family protein [Smithellaceae bacterium]
MMNYCKTVVMAVLGILVAGCIMKPVPLKQDEMLNRAVKDMDGFYKEQEPVLRPLSLEECMARALKYNLDHRLKLMEDALALRQFDLSQHDMLPRLIANAGYNSRDQYNAASSMNVFTNQESLAPSTSQEKNRFNADLTFTWNILDFGVSYFQARQQSDRAMIMTERRRKVVHTIMQQVRYAYWMALGSQQLEKRCGLLLKEVEQAIKDTKRIEEEKLRAPMETLTYQKTLLEILRQLEAFRDELAQANTRLGSLINLPLGQSLNLMIPASMNIPVIPEGLEQMEYRALLMRPEIREADYNDRISADEVKKSIARMLPGIELSAGINYDSNSFLVWNNWFEGGVRVTWNLLNLIKGPIQYQVATAHTEMTAAQRLALSMAILTQVHLSYHDFFSRQRQYDLSRQLQNIESLINEQTQNALKSGSQNRLVGIRTATTALMAEFRSFQNYAALQNAYGQIIATLGVDPLPETVEGHDVKTLSDAIRQSLSNSWVPLPIDPQRLKEKTTPIAKGSGTMPAEQALSSPSPAVVAGNSTEVTKNDPTPAPPAKNEAAPKEPLTSSENKAPQSKAEPALSNVIQQEAVAKQETVSASDKAASLSSVHPDFLQKPIPKQKAMKVIANTDSKRYHLPGMKYYDKVFEYHRIEFDSEEEAIKAGYRKAPR